MTDTPAPTGAVVIDVRDGSARLLVVLDLLLSGDETELPPIMRIV